MAIEGGPHVARGADSELWVEAAHWQSGRLAGQGGRAVVSATGRRRGGTSECQAESENGTSSCQLEWAPFVTDGILCALQPEGPLTRHRGGCGDAPH